jgi:hypothetical protein
MNDQKVTVTIKIPSQTVKLELSVPEMEVESIVNAICAQCEDYENYNDDNYSDDDEEEFDTDSFQYEE